MNFRLSIVDKISSRAEHCGAAGLSFGPLSVALVLRDRERGPELDYAAAREDEEHLDIYNDVTPFVFTKTVGSAESRKTEFNQDEFSALIGHMLQNPPCSMAKECDSLQSKGT